MTEPTSAKDPDHNCQDDDLNPVDHEENTVDWSDSSSRQSYHVYQCLVCGVYWGIRHQYDAGTGSDDHKHRFGPDIGSVIRHY